MHRFFTMPASPQLESSDTDDFSQLNVADTSVMPASMKRELAVTDGLTSAHYSTKWAVDSDLFTQQKSRVALAYLAVQEFLNHGCVANKSEERSSTADKSSNAKRKSTKSSKLNLAQRRACERRKETNTSFMFNPYEELIKATQTDSQSQTDGESHTLNEKINDTPVRNSMVSSKNSLMSKFNNLTSHIPVRYNVNSASSKISNKLSSHCQTTARKISRQKCRAQTFHKQLSLLSEYDEESQHDSVFQKQSQINKFDKCGSCEEKRSRDEWYRQHQLRPAEKAKAKHERNTKIQMSSFKETNMLKVKQRQEIYALNKVMTQLENERFAEFMSSTGYGV